MSFRGRGRGRGGYGGRGGSFNIQGKPFVLFPDVVLPDIKAITLDAALNNRSRKLRNFWRSSSYYIEAKQKKSEGLDIETYTDITKPKKKAKSEDIWQYMKPTRLSFPVELIQGSGSTRPQKKARWNLDEDMRKLDYFEKLEQNFKNLEEKGEIKKKADSEDEIDQEALDADEEFSDDGDYNQNIDFDDDDDDYNDVDDGEDYEPTY